MKQRVTQAPSIKIFANTRPDDIRAPNGRVFILKDEDVRVNVYVDGVKANLTTTTTNSITPTVPAGVDVLITGTGAGTGRSGGAGGGYTDYGGGSGY